MMNAKKFCLVIGSLAILNLSFDRQVQADPAVVISTPGTSAASPKDTPAHISVAAATEKLRLVTAGYRAGANTAVELNEAALALANAQLRLALSSDNTKDIQQALATIVVQQQQLLKSTETGYKVGAIDSSVMTQAQIALAQANARVDLYSLVSLHKQSLSQVQARYNAGAATTQDFNAARDSYRQAQKLFSESSEELRPTFLTFTDRE